MIPPRRPTPFDSAGLVTYVLRLANGQFVYDPDCARSCCQGFDSTRAFAWFSEQRALEVAAKTPHIGASATVQRGRP